MVEDKHKRTIKSIESKLHTVILWLEVLLAFFIIATVLLSGKDLVVLIYKVFVTEASASYQVLQRLLSHILLLVVGLELAIMLIHHTPGNVLEVMLYAVARKMLIYSGTSYDMLLGVIALALIFLVDKYFHTKDSRKILQ